MALNTKVEITLLAPGGRPGDIYVDRANPTLSEFVLEGRVLSNQGAPQIGADVTVLERRSLLRDVVVAEGTTDSRGRFRIEFSLPGRVLGEVFVRASVGEVASSTNMLTGYEAGVHALDLVVGEGPYRSRSEWELIQSRIESVAGEVLPEQIPADRLEWLATRAEINPLSLARYIQAHRLAEGRTVKPVTVYAFLRDGLSADLGGLLRAGARTWARALRRAWSEGWVPLPGNGDSEDLEQEVEDEIAAMLELVVETAVTVPTSGINQRVILDTAGLSQSQQRVFTQLWIAHEGDLSSFWTAVEGSSLSAEAPLLKFTLHAAAIAGNHLPLLVALQAERTATNISTMLDTIEWGVGDWDTMLDTRSVDLPEGVPGSDATERRQNYARALFNMLEDAYPSPSLRHSIARELTPPPSTEFLVTFLDNNPDFDIGGSNIAAYLHGATDPWNGIDPGDQAQALANLRTLQRVYRVAPRLDRYETTKRLLENNFQSALDVVRYTQDEFVALMGAELPSAPHHPNDLAAAIWANAAEAHSTALAIASQFAFGKSPADPVVLGVSGSQQFADADNGLSALSQILGNLDYCACAQCRSVFSPAAYLADMLVFLQDHGALSDMLERRPDIVHILLDCTNTHTVLPYIDLVNELLEAYVVTDGNLPDSSHQTTWKATELRLHPEHLDAAAYEESPLTDKVHPWSLPFSLPTIETRVYVGHLGIPRHELMRRCLPIDEVDPSASLDAIAGDVLSLSALEFEIISGVFDGNASSDDREFWGYAAGTGTDGWVNVLNGTGGDVTELLLRGRYTLDDLRELFELDFINPALVTNPTEAFALQFAETCKLEDATIALLDSAGLDRMHRFARLQRACKIPARSLNVLIADAFGGVLDGATLRGLAETVRLKSRLRLDWDVLATFWSNVVDARTYEKGLRSLYERRFLTKDLGGAEDLGDFVPDGNVLSGEQVPTPDPISAAQLPCVLAALGIKESEYSALTASSLATDDFSFANLTALFRSTQLARALRISIPDLVRLCGVDGLLGVNPFTSPAGTLDFVDRVDAMAKDNLAIWELDWILRHEFEVDPLDVEQVGLALTKLARGLAAINAEAVLLEDPTGSGLSSNLPELVEDVATVVKLVERAPDLGMDEGQRETFIASTFAGILDLEVANAVLADYENSAWQDVSLRRSWLFGQLVSHLRRRALVYDTIAAAVGVPPAVAAVLLQDVLHDPADADPGADPLFEVFRLPFANEEEIALELTPATKPNVFKAWTRAIKAGLVCRSMDLRADEVVWYSEAFLNLDLLPLEPEDNDVATEAWEDLRVALSVRDLSKPGEQLLPLVAAAANFSDALDVIAEQTGWDRVVLGDVATALSLTTVSELAEGWGIVRLRVVFDSAEQLGVPADTLFGWVAPTPTVSTAAAIKQSVRAAYGEDRWPGIAAPLRDEIRERQRDALLDATMAITPSFRTFNDVFEHLLIDVEMSHCMMTSRIAQAITSVQIYIHRVFLHLETPTFSNDVMDRWDWMKNYRVWEANRKVFLYPENWIEPELRLNKTPEFNALEATLLQGGLDNDRVETGLELYIEQIDRVSRLEVISVFEETGRGVWVLARTHAEPHQVFLRRKHHGWGPWEEVPVEMEGDAIAMVVEDSRVHLFWVMQQTRQYPYKPFSSTEILDLLPEHEKEDNILIASRSDESVPGVVYQIGHVERAPKGEWSKPQLSQPSPVLVEFERNCRLHAWPTETDIRLALMSRWPDDKPYVPAAAAEDEEQFKPSAHSVYLRAGFVYQREQQETRFVTTDFDESDLVATATVYLSLADQQIAEGNKDKINLYQAAVRPLSISYMEPSHIALQPEYAIRGQRYEHQWGSEEGGAVAFEIDGELYVYDSSPEWFGQTVFQKASKGGVAAFVHQANVWMPYPPSASYPVVYDDRKRKFLLSTVPVYEKYGADETPVPLPQGLDVQATSFFVCAEVTLPSSPPPRRKVERRRDRRDPPRTSLVFSGGVPEAQNPIGDMAADLLFQQAQAVMENNVGLGLDYDDEKSGTATDKLELELLYHPYAKDMLRALARSGVRGLYPSSSGHDMFRQGLENDPLNPENPEGLVPTESMFTDLPIEEFDFSYDSSYGPYNWELFYHVPMLIANKLAAEQRWDEAQKWYHYIFNPIQVVDEEGPSRFWRLKPFVSQAADLAKDQFQVMLGIGVSKEEQEVEAKAFQDQVDAWLANPFDPHAVARVRPGVYQRALIRKYFDNLIAWADHLFRTDTVESISEATVLYVLVAQLLGPRPHEVPGAEFDAMSFQQLVDTGTVDAFSNALIELESYIFVPTKPVKKIGCAPMVREPWTKIPTISRFWYFCYPPNPELLKYWDILEDRLFKIRHCQNIDGVERQLPLFQPPIDPALLVAARAAGVDLRSVLAELDSGLPPYRFRSVHARAVAFTNSLKSLASALLSALEKRDSEELALIRSKHEREMLALVRDIREQQIREARAALSSLESAKAIAEDRRQHYAGLISEGLSAPEDRHFDLASKAARMRRAAGIQQTIAGVLAAIPQISISVPPAVTFGGLHLAEILNATASQMSLVAAEHDYHANKAQTRAGYDRRAEDWKLQRSQAEKEIERIRRDIAAAQIRVQLAERELDNHDQSIQHAREVDQWMTSKFTNQQLYGWMVGELSTLYFQTYQLAFDLAKRAERAYRHELAIDPQVPIVIKYAYWDSLHKGLLAGDKLGLDLERLDLAYMDRDVREFELRKSISLASLDPDALHSLREGGVATFSLPEALYDLDHPGHYLRRIRSVRVTIPAVVGPHTTLGARLELVNHVTRIDKTSDGTPEGYAEDTESDDPRFRHGTGAGQMIATSSGMNDGGLFNLDFKDERYLPFEYAGAASTWTLTLPNEVRQFDYRTIEDVVIHIDYTAREGGEQLRTAAEGSLAEQLNAMLVGNELAQLVWVHEAFPNEWEQFFTLDGTEYVLNLPVTSDHFPYFARRNGFEVKQVDLVLILASDLAGTSIANIASVLAVDETPEDPANLVKVMADAFMKATFELAAPPVFGGWTFSIAESAIPEELQDDADAFDPTLAVGMLMVLRYELTP